MGMENSVTSIYMYCKNMALPPAMLFKNAGCEDRVIRIAPKQATGPTNLNKNDIQALGLGNDELDSVMVPNGWSLTLCPDDG